MKENACAAPRETPWIVTLSILEIAQTNKLWYIVRSMGSSSGPPKQVFTILFF